jgi:hypothetical protein
MTDTDESTEVKSDPMLGPDEREVTLGFAYSDDRVRVHSEITSVTRWLLQHPDFELTDRRIVDQATVAVTGWLPVGSLTLKGNPRKSQRPSDVLGEIHDE